MPSKIHHSRAAELVERVVRARTDAVRTEVAHVVAALEGRVGTDDICTLKRSKICTTT